LFYERQEGLPAALYDKRLQLLTTTFGKDIVYGEVVTKDKTYRVLTHPLTYIELRMLTFVCHPADEDSILLRAHLVDKGLGERCRYSQRSPVVIDEPVICLCPLQDNIRTVLAMEREETTVKIATLLLEDSDGDVYPCVAELLNTSSLNLSKRVYAPHHYPTYTFIYYKVGTRRGLAVVRTGLKTDVYSGFLEKSLILGTHAGKGINLSMTLAATDMVTLAEDSPVVPAL